MAAPPSAPSPGGWSADLALEGCGAGAAILVIGDESLPRLGRRLVGVVGWSRHYWGGRFSVGSADRRCVSPGHRDGRDGNWRGLVVAGTLAVKRKRRPRHACDRWIRLHRVRDSKFPMIHPLAQTLLPRWPPGDTPALQGAAPCPTTLRPCRTPTLGPITGLGRTTLAVPGPAR